jgi:hypothetical protein
VVRQSGQQHGHPRNIPVVFTGLICRPEDHLVNAGRINAGAIDDRRDDLGGKIVSSDIGKRATVATLRSANAVNEEGSWGHVGSP